MMTHDEVRDFLMRRIRAWEAEDLDAIMADYAPDVVHITPGGRRVGTATMRENNARYLAEYTGFGVELTRLILDGDEGALEWTWTEARRYMGSRPNGVRPCMPRFPRRARMDFLLRSARWRR